MKPFLLGAALGLLGQAGVLAAADLLARVPAARHEYPASPWQTLQIYHDGWIDLNKNGTLDPYENPALGIEQRIDDLLQRMTVNEKTCQLYLSPYCQSESYNGLLAEVLRQNGPYAVIHFNIGLHGIQTDRVVAGQTAKQPRIPADQFEPLTKAFVETILRQNPQARIVWANTTPVSLRDQPVALDPALNAIVIEHNRMAARVMAELKVPVNDCYGLLISHPELKQNDFHWKDGANKILGAACAEAVLKALPAKK